MVSIDDYPPMLFVYCPVGKAFTADEWLMEEKEDGARIVAVKNGATRLYTRRGNDVTGNFPEVVESLQGHPDGVYDGELTIKASSNPGATTVSGRAHMKPANARLYRYTQPATYHLFDLMRLGSMDLRDRPLMERKMALASTPQNKHVRIVEYRDAVDVDAYFREVTSRGGEGIVLKQKNSRYHRKRSDVWLKMKRSMEVPVEVVGVTVSDALPFGALVLARNGEYYCKVGTGLGSDADRRRTLAKLQKLRVAEPPYPLPGGVIRELAFSVRPTPAEIEVQEDTTNKNGGVSGRFPTKFKFTEDSI